VLKRTAAFSGILMVCLFSVGGMGATPNPTPAFSATATATPTALAVAPLDSVVLVPNPLGTKITFRATVAHPSRVTVKIHDHFYAPVTVLQKTGEGCFDVLWKVRKVPDGIYYFDSEIKDVKSGQVRKLPLQKVIVTQ